jgi:hypothetical protein
VERLDSSAREIEKFTKEYKDDAVVFAEKLRPETIGDEGAGGRDDEEAGFEAPSPVRAEPLTA